MILSWKRYFEIIFVVSVIVDTTESCDKDEHCKSHQVCCGKRCRSWPKCFLNSDKECYYDTHCIKGAICVSNVCKPQKLLPTSCRMDEDCDSQKFSSSYDRNVSNVKCCQGKCLDIKNCLRLLKINSTLTTPTTTRAISDRESCLETVNCPSGLDCINARCTVKMVVDSATENSEESDMTLSYKKGILSAVILIGAIFLTTVCYCCLKQTKYVQKHCVGQAQREDTAMTQSSCSSCSHQVGYLSAVLPQDHVHSLNNRNNDNSRFSQFTASWILFPRRHGINQTERSHGVEDRNCEHQEDCNGTCTGPPSYRSVCFDQELPPSYDEAMNCHCQNYTYNIPRTIGRTRFNT